MPSAERLLEDFPLDRYARLFAELAALPAGRAQILDRYGLDRRSHSELEEHWSLALATNASTSTDFRRLVAHHRVRLDVMRQAKISGARAERSAWPSAAVPAVVELAVQPLTDNLDETAWILAALPDEVLPFEDDPYKPPPPLANLESRPDIGATADAIPALLDNTLPFGDATPAASIEETAAVLAIVLDDLLPFHGAAAAPPPAALTANEQALVGETGFINVKFMRSADDALPFEPSLDERSFIPALVLDDEALPPVAADGARPPRATLGRDPDGDALPSATRPSRGDPRAFFGMPRDPSINETAAVPALILDDPLPFAAANGATPPVSRADPNEGDMSGETGFLDVESLGDLDASLPFETAAPAMTAEARRFGGLTVQQLAAVAVELTMAPQARATILAQYGLSEETARRAFDQLRTNRDPAVRAAWDDAYAQYHAYRTQRR